MTKPTGRRPGRPRKNPIIEDDDLDDLIGEAPPAKKTSTSKKGTPAKKTTTAPYQGTGAPLKPDMDLALVYGGVTADWLAQVFGSDRRTVQKKLARAEDARLGKDARGSMKYSLPHAVAYLVKPKVDVVAWIKSLRPNDLPPMLNDAYWAAMLKRQKWEENAKDLWRTEDVLEVLSDTAFLFKTTTQLWVEELDRHHGLTPEMRETITQLVDTLLEQVHEKMVEAPRLRKTSSSVDEEGALPPDQASRDPEDFDVV